MTEPEKDIEQRVADEVLENLPNDLDAYSDAESILIAIEKTLYHMFVPGAILIGGIKDHRNHVVTFLNNSEKIKYYAAILTLETVKLSVFALLYYELAHPTIQSILK